MKRKGRKEEKRQERKGWRCAEEPTRIGFALGATRNNRGTTSLPQKYEP
jgi:hypothetical protein